MEPFTIEYLKSILHYDPEIGIWIWLVKISKKIKIGTEAGNTHRKGYRRIKINGKEYKSSRLAWFYMTGEWLLKEVQVDHKDRNNSNDCWDNLRLANNSQNMCNKIAYKNNKLGIKGIYYDKTIKKYVVTIQICNKKIYLGSFYSLFQAMIAYKEAANEFHGEFANYG